MRGSCTLRDLLCIDQKGKSATAAKERSSTEMQASPTQLQATGRKLARWVLVRLVLRAAMRLKK